jgi:dipeptidyl aminopeptidase/acylaminoacyl peptidase
MRICLLLPVLLVAQMAHGQTKKPLDPSVYDDWQNVNEKIVSANGKYVVYTVTPQEGDGSLFIRATAGDYAKEIPRGVNAAITADSRFLVFLIRPLYKDLREARIKKKTPDQSPKDTLAWIQLGTDSLTRIPRVRSFKVPESAGAWLAYLSEKPLPAAPGGKMDSLTRIHQLSSRADSLEGTDLIMLNLVTGEQKKFALTTKYYCSKSGTALVVETSRKNADSVSKAKILWLNTASGRVDTVLSGFQDARGYALDEAGTQLAFVADRDSAAKALNRLYRLWYYTPGMDSAVSRADRSSISAAVKAANGRLQYPSIPAYVSRTPFEGKESVAMIGQLTVSPDYANEFSKDGSRLFFGLAPVRPPKDTTLVDFETARLDVWNYKDDYLSPEQLVRVSNELKRSYLAVITKGDSHIVPLADDNCEIVLPGEKGNGRYALGASSRGYRIQQQWEQNGLEKIQLVDLTDGSRKLIAEKIRGGATLSPGGKFVLWYDWKGRNWYTYDIAGGRTYNITAGIHTPLFDEEDDHPDDPPPHGSAGWLENDRSVFIYDKYDIWQCDPTGSTPPVNLTQGRHDEVTFRYVELDREDPAIHAAQWVLLTLFNHRNKTTGMKWFRMGATLDPGTTDRPTYPQSYNSFIKAKHSAVLAFLEGSFDRPYDLYVIDSVNPAQQQLSHINPQQASYNWMTVELKHWKMFDGRASEGLLYKPENFDSTKKYPIIFYFYERDADNLYDYMAPHPDRSIINITYFVSNGYLVFDPNIYYKSGQPGEDAYNSVISAARYLSRFKWVDTTKMGLEGHSWGGYQVAYLVTRTHLFAAAEAGAPVANMTSAYGGIRWGTGISRQFQYEKTQSRIGATLWQHPELYIKNSPLFRADKVTTPLLMMHNDADGAVPWYQGIEYFSALRRLGKKVWLLEYNGEDHGLMERRNQKDWSMRLSQFFDYYLKGTPPARWITDGVPATLKGIDWGLETP